MGPDAPCCMRCLRVRIKVMHVHRSIGMHIMVRLEQFFFTISTCTSVHFSRGWGGCLKFQIHRQTPCAPGASFCGKRFLCCFRFILPSFHHKTKLETFVVRFFLQIGHGKRFLSQFSRPFFSPILILSKIKEVIGDKTGFEM